MCVRVHPRAPPAVRIRASGTLLIARLHAHEFAGMRSLLMAPAPLLPHAPAASPDTGSRQPQAEPNGPPSPPDEPVASPAPRAGAGPKPKRPRARVKRESTSPRLGGIRAACPTAALGAVPTGHSQTKETINSLLALSYVPSLWLRGPHRPQLRRAAPICLFDGARPTDADSCGRQACESSRCRP